MIFSGFGGHFSILHHSKQFGFLDKKHTAPPTDLAPSKSETRRNWNALEETKTSHRSRLGTIIFPLCKDRQSVGVHERMKRKRHKAAPSCESRHPERSRSLGYMYHDFSPQKPTGKALINKSLHFY